MLIKILILFFIIFILKINIVFSFNLTILHNNDFHSHFAPINIWGSPCEQSLKKNTTCYGGVARTVAKVKEIRKNKSNVLFLNGGDQFQGTVWYSLYKWEVVAHFTKMLNFDAMAIGNHEFDDGVDGLIPFINATHPLPILSCNIDASKEPKLDGTFQKSLVITKNNKSIGIIGYTTPDTKFLSSSIPNLIFDDEITCIKNEVKKLKEQNIDILIALGHSGFKKDLEIAKSIPDLDIVVGGHTNTFLYTGPKPSNDEPADVYPVVVNHTNNEKTLVVQAYAFGKYLGLLNVEFDKNGHIIKYDGNPILMDYNIPEDPFVAKEVERYNELIKANFSKVIGKTFVHLMDKDCRYQECNIGNLITDSMVDFFLNKNSNTTYGWTDKPIAFMNGGNIRAGVQKKSGEITLEDVMAILPFGNPQVLLELSGKILKQMLEHSVTRYDNGYNAAGRFLQMSGVIVKYNISKPEMNRVQGVLVRCANCTVPKYEILNEQSQYKILVSKFIASGGDDFTMLSNNNIKITDYDDIDSEILERYIAKKSPVWTGIENRIIITK